jgi:glucose/mannose-6-phosphate isomerase
MEDWMNLDDTQIYAQLDKSDMLAELHHLPDQLLSAWKLGLKSPLPEMNNIKSVIIAGMGGSAIGGDLLAAYIFSVCLIPVQVLRDYRLPLWARGEEVLIVASSHSGNTEETVSVFNSAKTNRCKIIIITTGGKLADAAQVLHIPCWIFKHDGQPRSAVGFSFGLLLALFVRLGFIPDQERIIESCVLKMKEIAKKIDIDVPVSRNSAKRLAGQLIGRWVTIVGSNYLAPVARRWKTQINELCKAWAQFEFLPEVDHNTLAGVENPDGLLNKVMVLFLTANSDHPQNQLRTKLTRQEFMQAGLNTDVLEFHESTPLEEMWTCLLFGDYLSYYLAIAYDVDPTPVHTIQNLKNVMQ